MTEAKNRSRILILSYIASLSLQRRIGGQPYSGLATAAFHDGPAQPGDLVALVSAPASKWYLGWLISKQWPDGHACEEYTIESIEDGELCNWSNVSLVYYDRETIREAPQWRWTDAQHEFKDRWWNVSYKEKDAYIYLPVQPLFDGDWVELSVRVRHSFSKTVIRKSFPNWKKVTKKMMGEFYDAASAEIAAEKPAAVAS
jgi:hypothetical protein